MDSQTFIVGSIGPVAEGSDTAADLLKIPVMSLDHGGEFTGRPVTRIHLSDSHVLKINTSGAFDNRKIATAWCEKVLQKERRANLYHPRKTWFVLFEDDIWRVGNIAPRMSPLHTHLDQCDAGQSLDWLLKVSKLYLQHAAALHERLDEGLSNFGVTEDGSLYYLDDDFYSWDHFLCFTAMIAVWLRQFSGTWLNDELASAFGLGLSEQLRQCFSDTPGMAPRHIVYEHLGSQYMNEEAECRVEIVRAALMRSQDRGSDEPVTSPSLENRYSLADVYQWLEEDEPVAVLADIHANEPALQTVLDELKSENINRILCLGDIVGYGPHPTECIDLLCEAGVVCIRGNHDHMVGNGIPVPSMHGSGLLAAQWTISHIDQEHRSWLSSLPLQLRHTPWMAVHGAPQDPTFFNAYVYDRTAESNLNWMKEHDFKFCLHGHSHLQGCFTLKHGQAKRSSYTAEENRLERITLICPGSVGQPRGGSTDAEYAIIYPKSFRLVMRRCTYDIAATVRDMTRHQLPDQLIQRLWRGI